MTGAARQPPRNTPCFRATVRAGERINPSFPLTYARAQADLRAMRGDPKPLLRPLVFVCGIVDAGLGPHLMRLRLRGAVRDERVLTVHYLDCRSYAAARRKLIEAVDARFGHGAHADRTVEVDVIGQSLGGLVGWHAGADLGDGARRLNVRRLFALASPFTGARGARLPRMMAMQRELRPSSTFLPRLAAARHNCDVHPYVRLHDTLVGPEHSAPPGRAPWWLDKPPTETAHVHLMIDPRIITELGRHLRGEPPYTTSPPTPLPANAS